MSLTNAFHTTDVLSDLLAAFDRFAMAGGMSLDRTNKVGTAYLRLLSIERELGGGHGQLTNAPAGRLPIGGGPERHDQGTNSP